MDLELYLNYLKEEDTNEVLNDQKILTLVTNIESKKVLTKNNNSEKNKDDSKEISLITYYKVLNAITVLEQYLMQQDLSDTAWLDHDQSLLNLQKEIRNLRSASFKQMNFEIFFQIDCLIK
ncbi:9985_t:CDS:1 [Cetraspora pellucida]|uniref:9985_t:CDS:1 n=1 Tax=Cetraspora pellucida TaxID=1433469 RepID=A0ACA9M951_9GLOM|nr:9985_t:CDS:1 [Cetraspora pellucida]